MPAYNRLPIAFERGEGVWLWDTEDRKYLDAMSGIAVTVLGHSHPAIVEAITEQANKLLHTSNGYRIPRQEELARTLTELSGMDQAFFNHSGAEANELAIKLARLYGHSQRIDTPKIIVTQKAFHGRTLATLSACGNPKIKEGFGPLVEGFIRVPFNDIDAIRQIVEADDEVVAVMLEPILGNAGVIIPDSGYLREIRALCDKYNLLMILDEVQTGMGHTGKLFAYQHEDITPDILCLAKAMGNGIPIAACVISGGALGLIKPGQHGSTTGGNPFACHIALTVLHTLQKEHLVENAAQVGNYLRKGLHETLGNKEIVTAIRGKGLMIGIELNRSAMDLRLLGLEEGLIFNVTAKNVIRLLPPLILTRKEADILIHRLGTCLDNY